MTGTTERFIAAAQRAGFDWIDDLNDVGPVPVSGLGAVPLNIVDGVRTGSGAGYLLPALGRPNSDVARADARCAVAFRRHRRRGCGRDRPARQHDDDRRPDRVVRRCDSNGTAAHALGHRRRGRLRAAGVPVVAPLPVGASFSDHPEWVLPTDWTVAPGRPVLEVVLGTADDLEIRPYTGGFVAMTGDGTAGHAGLAAHRGGADAAAGARAHHAGRRRIPTWRRRIEHRYDSEPDDVAALRRGAEMARELAGAATLSATCVVDVATPVRQLRRWAPTPTRGPSSIIGAGCAASTAYG